MSAIYTTFLAHRAVINESQSLADRVSKIFLIFNFLFSTILQFLNSSQLLVFLLCITGLFDFLSIYDSVNDNIPLCVDTDIKDYPIHSTLKSLEVKCSTSLFSITGTFMIISSMGIYIVSNVMKKYRAYISIDHLWTKVN